MNRLVRVFGRRATPLSRRFFVASLVLLVLAVHGALVALAIASERRELANRLFLQTRDATRLAIASLDAILLPLLVAESARPSAQFDSFSAQAGLVDTAGLPLPTGEVLVPSPLLGLRLPLRILHFTWNEVEGLRSPQVPAAALRQHITDLGARKEALVVEAARSLMELEQRIPARDWQRLLESTRNAGAVVLAGGPRTPTAARVQPPASAPETLARRLAGAAVEGEVETPSLQAHFVRVGPSDSMVLLLLRRAENALDSRLEGVWIDWPRLRTLLLESVQELLAGRRVQLVPLELAPTARPDERMASLPAALLVGELEWPPPLGWSETRRALAVASLIVLVALALGAWALFAAWELGERRARFASGVTHELRTPLTTFQLYSELLAEDRIADPNRRKDALRTLRSEATRLARVVENVLSQARLERGSAELAREPFELAHLLERSRPGLQRRADEVGLELDLHMPPAGLRVLGDAGAVEQVLVNLVDNAAKYAHPSEPPTIEIRVREDSSGVKLSVRDFGPGVPPERRRQLFAPFSRAGAGPHVQGLGLGLSLSRELARSMGGDLVLEPSPSGACFVLRLGRAPQIDQERTRRDLA